MSGLICTIAATFRAMRDVASRTARIALVASMMFAFDIAIPDRNWTISSSEASTYTLTYDSSGGSAISPVSWSAGATLTLPTPSRPGYTFNGWSTRAAGSQLVYQVTNPNRSGNSIVYTAGFGRGGNDAAAVLTGQGATFDRVRYRMEANYNGTLRFADVAFDKWNSNLTLAQLAVPDLVDTRVIKTNVTNMHVQSNWNAVAGVATAVTSGSGQLGRIEFWPWNYGTGTSGVVPAGDGGLFDSDDTDAGSAIYGSFQVHNITNSHTVFAWNRHFETGNPDLGFGSYLQGHPDWTFVGRTDFDLATWKMKIFIGDLMLGGSTYSPTNNGSFTMYAQWTPNTSTVTYNYNNATSGNSVANATFTTGNSPITLPAPTRTNFAFEGWYSDSGFTNLVGGGGASYSPTSSTTLFAKWMTNQGAFSITNAPTQLGFSRTVTLGVAGGNGTGGVVFATTSPSVCSVNANTGVVTMLASTGSCSIAATKAADNTYYATSANASINAIKATQTALSVTGTNSGVYGSTLNLATSGGSTSGQVTWSVGSSTACTISSIGVVSITSGTGTCNVSATMEGSDDYEAVTSASFGVTVSKANQTALMIVDTEVTFGQTLSLVATGGSGTGALTWEEVSGTCTISGTTLTVGNAGSACVIRARRAADSNYNVRVSADTTINIVRASQSGFSITNTNSFVTGSSLSLSTTGGQTGGVVTWSVVSGVCTLSGTSLSASRGGVSCVVSASRAGNTNYLAATDSITITVDKIAQTLSFRSVAPTQAIVGDTYTVSVDSSAFLAASITVTNQSQSVCSISAGVVTFLSAGNCVVSASQAGTDVYASAAISQTIAVASAPQSTMSPQSGASSPSNSIPVPVAKPDTSKPLPVTTTIATTTTTTTTTTIPADPTQPQMGKDGLVPSLEVGESTAFIRGQQVAVSITQIENALLLTLPNDIRMSVGRLQKSSESVSVAADGALRMYRNETVDVEVQGFVPGTTYTFFMFSEPVELSRGVTDTKGSVAQLIALPTDTEYGDHTLQVVGVGPDGEIVSVSLGFEVLERTSNTVIVMLSLGAAVLLALLGGRPIFTRRRRQSQA